jgi:hypothetical protein
MQPDAVAPAVPASGTSFSNGQPLRHLVVLSVISFGLYPVYWLYRNLTLLKDHQQLAISPLARTFVAFLPIVGWPTFKDQLQLFAATAEAAGVENTIRPWPQTLGFQLVSAAMWVVPLPWGALGNAAAVPFLLPAQRALNAYWMNQQPGRPMRSDYSAGEITLAIGCGIVWGLLLVALFVGEGIVA